ncbi:MAG: tRNA (N(6)-L-threonylcarbamoyladenosine(37)-C(2))-methylthiotransferase MtaB [Clostridia bacterium]|nr:tRNA (N(6)-L-threonylcarbamoyladenosine(37)-C(2))-methylthiotransferase MtaB [Clostridia bacterium]
MIISFKTLGCKVNQYETEVLKEQFQKAGHTVTGDEEYADVYIINTCTVTGLADRKSRQYVRRMKRINPDALIAVTGCYAQISPQEVAAIEGVNLVVGTNEKLKLAEYVEKYMADTAKKPEKDAEEGIYVPDYEELTDYVETGIITSMESRTRAYIKIQEGCNRFCSYCVIPYARGKVRSRDPQSILAEAKQLISNGFREIILTGINTALYGTEKDFTNTLDDAEASKESDVRGVELIIRAIDAIPGDFRIRLSSLEPTVVNAEYVKRLFAYPKLCHHLHLSVQSGSDEILRSMNRNYDRKEYLDIVAELKKFDPLYGITTDIIAGFPGETEENFSDSLKIIDETGFCRVHPFKYSNRPGTRATAMENQVKPAVKKERMEKLSAAGEKSARLFYEKNRGTTARVLFEEFEQLRDEERRKVCGLDDTGGGTSRFGEGGSFSKEGLLSGYTDNYIKVYLPCNADEAAEIQKNFADVKLCGDYKEGMLCSL